MDNPRKEDIIIELGDQYIRVGLVGDKVPRKTIKSKDYLKYNQKNIQAYEISLEELLYNIFFSYINSPCQGKTVVLLQKVYMDRRVLELMAKIMFKKLKIDKLQLSLSCVTPLYLSGKYSGIVISSGSSATQIMAIYQGYPFFRNFQCINGGTSTINKLIRDELSLMNPQINRQDLKAMTEDDITQIKHAHISTSPAEEQVLIPYKRNRLKFVPAKIKLNYYFGNPQNEQPNIAYSFLKIIDSLPQCYLNDICKNIIFAGGLWRIKGMQKLFKKQVVELLPLFPKLILLKIKQKLSFISWSFNPSELSWIGCSIGASIRNVDHLCLKKAQYLQNGYIQKIMASYYLSS